MGVTIAMVPKKETNLADREELATEEDFSNSDMSSAEAKALKKHSASILRQEVVLDQLVSELVEDDSSKLTKSVTISAHSTGVQEATKKKPTIGKVPIEQKVEKVQEITTEMTTNNAKQ